MDEIIIQWRIVSTPTDVNYAIQKSNAVKATSVMLLFNEAYLSDINGISTAVQTYRQAGFKVYPCVGAARMLTPADINPLLALPITGIAIDLSGTYTKEEGEAGLVALAQACQNAGKSFAYYHGDGMSSVDAVKMGQAGCIVWAWYNVPNWKPGTWDLPVIWAQSCIWNRLQPDGTTRYSKPEDILNFYNALPRRPEAILWWLTTCNQAPTDEQVQAMREVADKYLPSAPPLWNWPLLTWVLNLIEKGRG